MVIRYSPCEYSEINQTEEIAMRFLRINEVRERIGLGRTSIYKMVNEGTFPKPVRVLGKKVAWIDSEVDEWMMQRIADERGDAIPNMNY
jgi:prophage regulatory protein